MTSNQSSSSTNKRSKAKPWPTPTHGDALKSKGVIRFKVAKFAEFGNSPIGTRKYSEPPVFIRGLPWQIMVEVDKKKESAEKWLSCAVCCNKDHSSSTNWGSIDAFTPVRILARREGKKDILGVCTTDTFDAENRRWVDVCIESIERLMDPENGWYNPENDTITVKAEIRAELPRSDKHMAITVREMERLEMWANQMKNLLTSGNGADVHFLVGDKKEIRGTHKNILFSASEVFEKMFLYNDKQQQKEQNAEELPIEVPDIGLEVFRVMLGYIYTKNPEELNWDNLFDVLYAAKKYMVTGLIQACVDCLDYLELDHNNVLFVLGQARLHEEKSLADCCWAHIDNNVYAVTSNDNFLKIDSNLLAELLGRDTLKMSKKSEGEIALWNAAIRWADEQCRQKGLECSAGENRRQVLGTALFKIRLPLIGHKDLAEKIVPTGVLTNEEAISVVFCLLNPNSEAISKAVRTMNVEEDKYRPKFPMGRRA